MIGLQNIPKHWQVKKLGDIAKWGSGGTPTSTNSSYYGGNIPWLIIGDLNDSYITDSKNSITDLGLNNSSAKIVKPESVLVAMYGSIGKLGINKIPVATNQAIAFTQLLNDQVNNRYLFYFLFHIRSKLHSLGKGGTQKNISQTVLKQVKIPIPPLAEQQAIVSKIEELFSDLENGRQQLLSAQQQLKVYRQSLLKAAFEGSLTASAAATSSASDRSTMVESVETTGGGGELPNGWRIVFLKDVVEKISDGPFGSNLKTSDYVDEGVRIIRLENIGEMKFRNEYKTFISDEKYKTIKNHTVGKGDIIFSSFISETIRTTILPEYVEKAVNKADCFLVRVSNTKINKKYLIYYFSTKEMRNQLVNQIHGATRPRINTTQLKATLIPFAPLKDQQLIVEELESKLTVCDKIEETISQSLQQAETLKQSILKKAFEGKLV